MDSKHYYFLSAHDERTLVLIKHFIILTDQLSDCLDKKKYELLKRVHFCISRLPLSDIYFVDSIQINKNSNLIILLKDSKPRPRVHNPHLCLHFVSVLIYAWLMMNWINSNI